MLRRAYFADYSAKSPSHGFLAGMQAEIADFRQRVPNMLSLALAVSMAKYHFSWYKDGSSEMDVVSVEDAADLMYASIQFSGCNKPDLTADAFYQRMCSARWPYVVLMYSELGREFATRYLTEQAATILEKAIAAFEEMKRLPHYAPRTHWQSPYDINFNEEWFPGVALAGIGPVWNKDSVPLAQFLELNFQTFSDELGALVERGQMEALHIQGMRAEGQDHAPVEARRAVEFMTVDPSKAGHGGSWDTSACREAPRTCRLLASRPELQGCHHPSAALVSLGAGGRLKPHYGAAPKLTCQLALQADPGARMSVGNRTLVWSAGEALVFDDSFIRQEWHAGVRGERYVLQLAFCHPCEASQRSLYPWIAQACPSPPQGSQMLAAAASSPAPLAATGSPQSGATSDSFIDVPFAAAALWAATLPELEACNGGIGERCPPDTQHGGANPLSALNTWNYAMNNLRAALRHAGQEVDPALFNAIAQVQGAIQSFFQLPALEQFGPIVDLSVQIFQAMAPWLQKQAPARLRILPSSTPLSVPRIPSDGGHGAISRVNLPLGATGFQMPAVGFGTWKLDGASCYQTVLWALEAGYRHIDTAEAYSNEAEIGRALRDSGVPRSDVFLATKATSVALGMAEPGYLETVFAGQLQALQTEYVDVYMLHAAGVQGETLRAVWQGMERLVELGRVRALGVSNFGLEELEDLWTFARVKPAYVQNIFKVYKQGEQILGKATLGVLEWARNHGVAMVGYSVINSWPHLLPPLQDPHVVSVARTHQRTTSQVLHRWAMQHGIAVIPKASSKERIWENGQLFDFELSQAEMSALDGLATLSESTHAELRPPWSPDLYGLRP